MLKRRRQILGENEIAPSERDHDRLYRWMGVFEGVLEFRDCAVSAKSGNVFIFIVGTDRFENKVRKRGGGN